MNVTRVCCQGCGADLDVDETIRFVTCNYCHARLEVVHDATITHTRRLEKVEKTTDQISRKLEVLELQNSIGQLDREWEKYRSMVLMKNDQGDFTEPSDSLLVLGGIVGVGLAAALVILCLVNAVFWLALLGIVFAIAIFYVMKKSRQQAHAYYIHRHRYDTARKSLLQRLHVARQGMN